MTSSTGCSGFDLVRIAAERDDAVAHRRQIDHARHAGEVLQQHARRHEGDLLLPPTVEAPRRQRADVVGLDERAVLAAQQVLEQNLQRERQARDVGETGLLERRQAVVVDGLAADGESGQGLEGVGHHWLLRKRGIGRSYQDRVLSGAARCSRVLRGAISFERARFSGAGSESRLAVRAAAGACAAQVGLRGAQPGGDSPEGLRPPGHRRPVLHDADRHHGVVRAAGPSADPPDSRATWRTEPGAALGARRRGAGGAERHRRRRWKAPR